MSDLKALKETIDSYVDAHVDEMTALLSELIKIRSISATEEQECCQEIVTAELKKMGAEVDRWIPDWEAVKAMKNPVTGISLYQPTELNTPEYTEVREKVRVVVGTLDSGKAGRSIMLNGHIDVVSEEPAEQWTVNPWGGEIREGKVYGRGASDQKGGVVSMLLGAKAALACAPGLRGKILISTTPDEENGGNGAAAVVAKGYFADGGILTDGMENRIVSSCIGMQRYRVDFTGKASFMGEADEGVSAIDLMTDAIINMRAWEEKRNRAAREIYGFAPSVTAACANRGFVNGGEWHASIPARASLQGLMGILAHEDIGEFRDEFKACIYTADKRHWFDEHPPVITYYGAKEGCITDRSEAIVKAVEAGLSLERGTKEKAEHSPVCTDMHYFTNSGTPSVVMGPGKKFHCADEYVEIASLVECAKAIALSIVLFCNEEV